jgi:rhodanese-related sulfurtransferase
VGQWDLSQGVISANARNDDGVMDELEIEDVKIARQIYDSRTALFVDARARETYEEGHIPGAVSLPVGGFDEYIDSFMSEYSTDRSIVTYCSGRTCEDSHELAMLLQESGFFDVRVFIDGFPGWEAEGYPIE